ncbi:MULTISPECIES: hypothetical protein [Bacillaceae]|uniref:hypothetical protein n=1 Tax=Bacillaceae TaxID=186817 RepID=UPI0011893C22|nr:hypothetical protein [Bacillus sp. S3]QCJ40714.1 hypothetical protein FAY30_01665 [Bacillus sp. S3]
MKRGRTCPSSKKITVSLHMEGWLWNVVDQVADNRSKFFRELLLDEMREELVSQKVMAENGEVTELLGEVYLSINIYKSKLKAAVAERLPVRSKIRVTAQDELRSKIMGIHLEKWLCDIAGKIAHNRSVLFKNLLIKTIKAELLRAGLVEKDTFMTEENAESYILLKRQLTMHVS